MIAFLIAGLVLGMLAHAAAGDAEDPTAGIARLGIIVGYGRA